MKITDLAQHLHQIRHNHTGRSIGNSMRATEVWEAVLQSDKTSISRIDLHLEALPRPIDGMFARVVSPKTDEEIAAIYVHDGLEKHWQEFVAIKEMMHCFTPLKRYCPTPEDAGNLLQALVKRSGRYTQSVAADDVAILAAAEVMLPHTTVESLLAQELSIEEISHRHGLHPDVVAEICRYDIIHYRKNGHLNGDF